MSLDLRTVIDASVLVSAVLSPSATPRTAVDLAMTRGPLLVSIPTIREIEEVIRRSKFDRFLTEKERLRILGELLVDAEEVGITEFIAVCRDPKDDKYLELAVSGKATHIVTGDADLLVLNPFRGISILTAAEFVALMEAAAQENQDAQP